MFCKNIYRTSKLFGRHVRIGYTFSICDRIFKYGYFRSIRIFMGYSDSLVRMTSLVKKLKRNNNYCVSALRSAFVNFNHFVER